MKLLSLHCQEMNFCDVMRKSATETIKEYGEGDGVISAFLVVVTAHMAAKIERKIFNNKEDK